MDGSDRSQPETQILVLQEIRKITKNVLSDRRCPGCDRNRVTVVHKSAQLPWHQHSWRGNNIQIDLKQDGSKCSTFIYSGQCEAECCQNKGEEIRRHDSHTTPIDEQRNCITESPLCSVRDCPSACVLSSAQFAAGFERKTVASVVVLRQGKNHKEILFLL